MGSKQSLRAILPILKNNSECPKMKTRRIKLTPEQLIQILQGKLRLSSLPDDAELLDVKCDLSSNQIVAVISSQTFEDVKDSKPIPEFEFNLATKSKAQSIPATNVKTILKPTMGLKSEPAQFRKNQPQPAQYAGKMEEEFSPEQRRLLSFKVEGDCVIVKPTQFLKAEWEDINDVVKSLGGNWIKGDIISYWTIPLP